MPLVVIGLGNPGEEYCTHRHNIGFQVVDNLGKKCGVRIKKAHFLGRYEMGKGSSFGRTFFLVKPLTFMNRSGEIVKTVLREAKASISDLVIVCDNLDLATGVLKLKPNGSSGGHRGLESIFYSLKTDEIMRLSIGIGRPNRRGAVVDHVLGEPDKEESMILEGAVEKAAFFILRLLTEPKEKVMGDVNRRVKNDGQA